MKNKLILRKPSLTEDEVKLVKSNEDIKTVRAIPINSLVPGEAQPRKFVTKSKIDNLVTSIREHGLLHELIVRPLPADSTKYEIICGERRWHALRELQWAEVPCKVRLLNDKQAAALALIDNIQRENLNPIEEAEALIKLRKEHDYTMAELGQITGKSRSTVNNIMRLLELDDRVQSYLFENRISMGTARALITLPVERQYDVANKAIEEPLSVRQVEELCRSFQMDTSERDYYSRVDSVTQKAQEVVNNSFRSSVKPDGRIKVGIEFSDLQELESFLNSVARKLDS